ncbi:alpha/beta fold hydrolase [Spiroplasma eriocheiris]|uniref:Lysophospholipase n=1 Tax=Spiroplasma eriocheiris TaxID=315358 RepID=A0A0H3XM88_9MOLU|nr:alpha/beta fold hydrolase [Spiroplasma eriocheiris]AHF58267.1 lysophospholipase [Spiroplasma eriocheiris CCTCC M 207170]AKM54704.1 lysophospholipase [Spiroplasma eriocheiris]AKP92781.1 lysophospholipase [Spiroplasma eriocheiris]
MEKVKEFELKLRDGKDLHMYEWLNVENPKGVLQLVHGSCEHALRYQDFANFLNKNGYLVIANDHRGHGKTVKNKEDFGYFADENGWQILVDDLYEVNKYIQEKYPHLPIVMFGHSMGSFLARHYAIEHGDTLKAVVFCGTAHYGTSTLKFARRVAARHQKKYGPKVLDKFIHKHSYAPLNKKFRKEGNTGAEWISSDKDVQQGFLKDPLTFPVFTTSGYKDLFSGLMYIENKDNIQKTPKQLPILFLSGKNDPVGKFGKMVIKTHKNYLKYGYRADIKLYNEMRHEILNEKNKGEVYQDILAFYNSNI